MMGRVLLVRVLTGRVVLGQVVFDLSYPDSHGGKIQSILA